MPKSTSLRIGSTVKVVNPELTYYGQTGMVDVIRVDTPWPIMVQLEGGDIEIFAAWELAEVDR